MRTIAITLVCVLGDNGSEMFLIAMGMPLRFLALISGAVVAELNIFLFLEFLKRQSFFVCLEFFKFLLDTDFVLIFKE